MSGLRHGTTYHYDLGCRCDDCRTAKLAKRRDFRARGRAIRSAAYLNELATMRALKERYRGSCVDCGSPTSGANGPGLASERCVKCNGRLQGLKKRGHGKTVGRALELLARGDMRYMEIANALGITPAHTGGLLYRLREYGLIERPERGLYRLAAQADPTEPA